MTTNPLESFWQRCQQEQPAATAGRPYRVRGFGNTESMSRAIIDLVRTGAKTGTFAMQWEFDGREHDAPAAGDLYIVTAFDGTPELLLRIDRVETVPFAEIGAEHTALEGPNARDVGVWRSIHEQYWNGMLTPSGRRVGPGMPVLVQRFTVLVGAA